MPNSSRVSPFAQRDAIAALVLAIVTFVVFWPALGNGFIDMDDPDYVAANPRVLGGFSVDNVRWALTTFDAANWHPLTWLSLQLDATAWKQDPRGYHLTNVLLHSVNAALVFLVARALVGESWQSVIVSLLFAVHPLRVESVAWIAERKDVLSTAFGLLAVLAYCRYAKVPTASRYLPVAVALGASLMAKPMLVTLPFLLLLLDWWPLARTKDATDWPRLVVEKLPLVALCFASCAVTVFAQHAALASLHKLPPGMRLETAVMACAQYLRLTVWPFGLAVYYPIPPDGWPAAQIAAASVLLVAATALCVWQMRRRPYLLAGWLWFVGSLVPVLGFIQVGRQAYADRYTYFAQIGLWLAVTRLVGELVSGFPKLALATAAVVAVLFVARTQEQLGHWHDARTLWESSVAAAGESPWGLSHLAFALERQRRYSEAVNCYRRALDLDPTSIDFHNNLGVLLGHLGERAEAERLLMQARELGPDVASVHISLGNFYFQAGRYDEAVPLLEEAIRLEPDSADAYNSLGMVEERRKNLDRAADCFRQALQIRPDFASPLAALGGILLRQGHDQEGLADLRQALRCDPHLGPTHLLLGIELEKRGESEEAAGHIEQAARLSPELASAWYHLGKLRMRQGQFAQSIDGFTKAVGREPASAFYRGELAKALVALADACANAGQNDQSQNALRKAREQAASAGQNELVRQIDGRLHRREPGTAPPAGAAP
jgi:tetratricopeptide (TPR) repeat protein